MSPTAHVHNLSGMCWLPYAFVTLWRHLNPNSSWIPGLAYHYWLQPIRLKLALLFKPHLAVAVGVCAAKPVFCKIQRRGKPAWFAGGQIICWAGNIHVFGPCPNCMVRICGTHLCSESLGAVVALDKVVRNPAQIIQHVVLIP